MTGLTAVTPPDTGTVLVQLVEPNRLTMSGKISGSGEQFGIFFRKVHEAATEAELGRVVVDVRDLTFVSALLIRAFAEWVDWIDAAPRESYELHFITKRSITWQTTAFADISRKSEHISVDLE